MTTQDWTKYKEALIVVSYKIPDCPTLYIHRSKRLSVKSESVISNPKFKDNVKKSGLTTEYCLSQILQQQGTPVGFYIGHNKKLEYAYLNQYVSIQIFDIIKNIPAPNIKFKIKIVDTITDATIIKEFTNGLSELSNKPEPGEVMMMYKDYDPTCELAKTDIFGCDGIFETTIDSCNDWFYCILVKRQELLDNGVEDKDPSL